MDDTHGRVRFTPEANRIRTELHLAVKLTTRHVINRTSGIAYNRAPECLLVRRKFRDALHGRTMPVKHQPGFSFLASSLFHCTCSDRAQLGNRSYFYDTAVFQARTLFCDLQCFLHAGDLKVKVAANGFLGFGEWAVRYNTAILAGYKLAFVMQRMTTRAFPFPYRALEPSRPIGNNRVKLFW